MKHVTTPAHTNGADQAPVALVRRVRSRGANLLVVDVCPFCGKPHTHGAGADPARPLLGHRVAHCSDPLPSQRKRLGTVAEFRARCSPGYILVEPAPANEAAAAEKRPVVQGLHRCEQGEQAALAQWLKNELLAVAMQIASSPGSSNSTGIRTA